MHPLFRVLYLLPMLALTACAVMDQSVPMSSVAMTADPAPVTVAPAATTASAAAMTDVSAYVDPTALGQLSGKSKSEAAGAQFNALQFGRVGAPRNWVGDKGATGQVTVGPYIRVNLIDCRDFTHTVTINGTAYAKKGTACREADGSWTVSASKIS